MSSTIFSVLLGLTVVASVAFPQSPEMFEVAAIKLADPTNPATSFHFAPGGSVKIEGASLKDLVLFAYDLREFQLVGATGWLSSQRYNILAKGAEGSVDSRQINGQQRKAIGAIIRNRMQTLLAERFQLTFHWETKGLPIYALVVAKNGLKMQLNTGPDDSPQSTTMGRSVFKAQRASLEDIAHGLAGFLGRPVRDETGLAGFYDFKLEWAPDLTPPSTDGTEERRFDTSGPILFTALQEQLGLKLEPRKGPVKTLVIDRAERPSEN